MNARISLGTLPEHPHRKAVKLLAASLAALSLSTAEANGPDNFVMKPDQPRSLKKTAAMETLRPGEVTPRGWLRDWCVTARNGYVSRLDEVDIAFQRAWSDDFHPRGQYLHWGDQNNGAWCAEGGAYWFEGLVRLAWALDDANLKAFATRRLAPLLDGMHPNAIGLVYWLDRTDPAQFREVQVDGRGWIMPPCGGAARALLAYWEATGDTRAMNALVWSLDDPRVYAMGDSLTMPAGAVEVWRQSGDPKLADALDSFFANKPTPSQWFPMRYGLPVPYDSLRFQARRDDDPNTNWNWRLQHGVVAFDSLVSFAKAALWTGDATYLANVREWLAMMDKNTRQPHGATVADEQYGWAGPLRGTETCDVADDLMIHEAMAAITGEGRFADTMERICFNAGAACVSRDFMHHVYFQTPNRLDNADIIHAGPHTHGGNGTSFETKHWPLCCTAALTRILPGFVQWMWMKPRDGGLAAVLYGPNTLETDLGGTAVRIETTTDYPFHETLQMRIEPAQPLRFPLKLRVPEWCANPSIAVNGDAAFSRVASETRPEGRIPTSGDGFAVIDREWRTGDTITIRFPMEPHVATMRDFNDDGKPYCSLSLGPLLFAHGLAEIDENTPQPGQRTDWKLDSSRVLDGATVERDAMPSFWNWPLAAPLRLRVQASDGSPLDLVPYGCAKLRISMFPDEAEQ